MEDMRKAIIDEAVTKPAMSARKVGIEKDCVCGINLRARRRSVSCIHLSYIRSVHVSS